MTDSLNLFDERATECVNLCLRQEECTSSSREDSKMYRPGTITNSRRMPPKTKKTVLIAKVRILVEQVIL